MWTVHTILWKEVSAVNCWEFGQICFKYKVQSSMIIIMDIGRGRVTRCGQCEQPMGDQNRGSSLYLLL